MPINKIYIYSHTSDLLYREWIDDGWASGGWKWIFHSCKDLWNSIWNKELSLKWFRLEQHGGTTLGCLFYNIISTHVLAFYYFILSKLHKFQFSWPLYSSVGFVRSFFAFNFPHVPFRMGFVLAGEKENMIRTATPKEESIKIDNFCATLKRSSLHHRTAQQQLTVQPALCRALNFRLQSIIQDYIAPRCRRERERENHEIINYFSLYFVLPPHSLILNFNSVHPARRRCRRDKASLFHFDIQSWLGCFQCCVISEEPRDVNWKSLEKCEAAIDHSKRRSRSAWIRAERRAAKVNVDCVRAEHNLYIPAFI